jgi:putative selenate reductase
MRLGDYDSSGRRGIEGTGKREELSFDTVIGAVGSRVDTEAFARNGIKLNAKGFPELSAGLESSVPGVYVTGDCKTGAATVVKAIADAKAASADILRKLKLEADFSSEPAQAAACTGATEFSDFYLKKGVISELKQDNTDAYRCLSCNTLCEVCVDVCPNRANVMVELPPHGFLCSHQVLHIDRMCNECGNCATFCPHAGKPYKDKLTVFCSEKDFAESKNSGFFRIGGDKYKFRLEDKSVVTYLRAENTIPDTWIALIDAVLSKYEYLLV